MTPTGLPRSALRMELVTPFGLHRVSKMCQVPRSWSRDTAPPVTCGSVVARQASRPGVWEATGAGAAKEATELVTELELRRTFRPSRLPVQRGVLEF